MKDTIYRQAAIDAVKCGALSAAMVYGRTDEGSTALYETVKAIKALPSAQPERKQGKWIKTISENGITSAVRCSECGFEDNRYMLFRYCPHCGADMRGEQDG